MLTRCADRTCKNMMLDDQGSNDQRRRHDTLTELTSQSTSSPIQLRLREIVISMKRGSAKLKGNAVGVVMRSAERLLKSTWQRMNEGNECSKCKRKGQKLTVEMRRRGMIPDELLTASMKSQRCPTNTSIGGADSEMQRRVTSTLASSSSRHCNSTSL